MQKLYSRSGRLRILEPWWNPTAAYLQGGSSMPGEVNGENQGLYPFLTHSNTAHRTEVSLAEATCCVATSSSAVVQNTEVLLRGRDKLWGWRAWQVGLKGLTLFGPEYAIPKGVIKTSGNFGKEQFRGCS